MLLVAGEEAGASVSSASNGGAEDAVPKGVKGSMCAKNLDFGDHYEDRTIVVDIDEVN
jgi:hypothetical protein